MSLEHVVRVARIRTPGLPLALFLRLASCPAKKRGLSGRGYIPAPLRHLVSTIAMIVLAWYYAHNRRTLPYTETRPVL